ncbi:MAG: hypothetical protein LBD08_02360 [Treponema sp.]|jgi:hypothetical protein|nr:hypothetical protein [Treponema sp.]
MPAVRQWVCAFILTAAALAPACAQEQEADPADLVGVNLRELVSRFGPPDSVLAVRGIEEWQDDVVFVYRDQEFYIFKDQIWQLGLKSFSGVSVGTRRERLAQVFGEALESQSGYILFPLAGRSMPLTLRFNTDARDLVSAIFIYRSDF